MAHNATGQCTERIGTHNVRFLCVLGRMDGGRGLSNQQEWRSVELEGKGCAETQNAKLSRNIPWKRARQQSARRAISW